MLQLISDHGNTISTGFFQNNANTHSMTKCLRYLRKVLNLDASLATLDAGSISYQLLNEMAEDQDSIAFQGQIYIPVKWNRDSIWGFIKIEDFYNKPTKVQIKKAVQAVQDLLIKKLDNSQDTEPLEDSSFLIVESSVENSHRVSTNLFQDKKFTAFINVSEWIIQEQHFTLTSLREFSDSLLFIPEIMSLTADQRSVLALYSLLPRDLKKSSLVVATKLSNTELSQALVSEPNFLKAFSNKTVEGDLSSDSNILGL